MEFSGFYGKEKFTCGNGQRIYQSQVCNGMVDCEKLDDGDNSDEQNCGNIFMILKAHYILVKSMK